MDALYSRIKKSSHRVRREPHTRRRVRNKACFALPPHALHLVDPQARRAAEAWADRPTWGQDVSDWLPRVRASRRGSSMAHVQDLRCSTR